MNAIRSVFSAVANLAASINQLAGILDSAADRLRHQLALDGEPALTHNGEVLDGKALDGSSLDGEPAVSGPTGKRGRRSQ